MRVFDRAARAGADAAADDEVDALLLQPGRDLLMVGIVKGDGLLLDGLDILNAVNGKLLGLAKVLEHLAILAGDGNFHGYFSFPLYCFGGSAAARCCVVVYHAFACHTTGNL